MSVAAALLVLDDDDVMLSVEARGQERKKGTCLLQQPSFSFDRAPRAASSAAFHSLGGDDAPSLPLDDDVIGRRAGLA